MRKMMVALLALQFAYPYINENEQPKEERGYQGKGFTFCRLFYTRVRTEADGHGWSTDYPGADKNLSIRFSELTTARIQEEKETPRHLVLKADDPELMTCPFIIASDVGTMELSESEVKGLREYLVKGGFLWVDDFWGTRAWNHWESQIKRVLPEYLITTPEMSHPLFNIMFRIQEVPQVSHADYWLAWGKVSERGDDSPHPNIRIIRDWDNLSRILVLMTHNTDIQDTWEKESYNARYFDKFSPDGYALGINTLLYAMSH